VIYDEFYFEALCTSNPVGPKSLVRAHNIGHLPLLVVQTHPKISNHYFSYLRVFIKLWSLFFKVSNT